MVKSRLVDEPRGMTFSGFPADAVVDAAAGDAGAAEDAGVAGAEAPGLGAGVLWLMRPRLAGMSSPYTAVLFDLDGTIVDSAPGITSTLAATFEAMSLPVPTPAELVAYVGPPILDSFRDLAGFDPATSHRALDIYRGLYLERGVYDATVYPGVEGVLAAVRDAGLPLSLATSKPERPARLVLEHFDLVRYFDELTGASADETRSAKKDVIAEALRRLEADGADLSRTIMVGDRIHDIEGAHANGIPTIYVTWGYGSPAESAGAIEIVDDTTQLLAALGL